MVPTETTVPQIARQFTSVLRIIEQFGYNKNNLVPILQAVQEEYRYLPQEVMTFVATALDISPARVFGVASFYSHFALEPKGKYVIKVCDGTACHVKGSQELVDTLQERLKLPKGKKTTPDMLFTLETVSCLGACGLAPAVVINEDVHGQVTPAGAIALIDNICAEEGR
ncbi:MAG: NADH-quinone oxidoreductase subunit NuoE [Holophagales bacterium]|jgi:NADH-quinone oxidoreductase subunit E|nr:NADH-quinone oxidoreductase subunit NuoE [Holophagales bacterium]